MKKRNKATGTRGKYVAYFLTFCISLFIGGHIYSEKHRIFDEKKQTRMAPDQVLRDLIAGNKRFCEDMQIKRRSLVVKARRAHDKGQFPKAVVLACMDSRSIPELIFDQTIADIFTLRVAGNIINDDMLASLEYATKHSGSKLIVIMGHTQCGAIHAACAGAKMSGKLECLAAAIKPAIDVVKEHQQHALNCDNEDTMRAIALQNVRNMILRVIEGSEIIRELVANGSVKIVGALHDLKTGVVTFEQIPRV